MKKLYILLISAVILGFSLMASPVSALNPLGGVCQYAPTSPACQESKANPTNPASLLSTVINIASLVVGLVAVIMIVIGGLMFIVSGGESQKVATAKNTVIYALVGLVIAVFAQLIVHFVLVNVGGG